ncbi:MAG: DNA primase large subunit PriL [Methanobacteriota archaeon]|nr:MAG: DNA primase large subunit PriL [Euryarchaeota archaeon]
MIDARLAARYPFMRASSELLKRRGVTLDGLISSMAYESARTLGKERVLEAVEFPRIVDHPITSEADAMNELLSYPVARMIVSCLGDEKFIRRYAIAEAKLANSRLTAEIESGRERETKAAVDRAEAAGSVFTIRMAEELGLQVSRVDGSLAVDFTDFLRFSTAMKSKSWKLVNQDVRDGMTLITEGTLIRLVEQMIADKISSELPLPVNDVIIAALADDVEEVGGALEEKRAEHPERDFGRVSIVRFPPCMKALLDMIRRGENVPHTGRFAIVAFLHTLGMDSETILSTFAASADFDEGKSRYQIQHITGEISGTEYTPPECSTMKSYGICFDPDALCDRDWMNHPLTYYRVKGKKPGRSRRAVKKEPSRSGVRAGRR